MDLLCTLLTIYLLVLLVRIATSWFPAPTSPAGERFVSILWSLTEPVLRPFRSLFPPMRLGGMALDLSALAPFIIIIVLRNFLCS
jgi:YggT family protein